MPPTEVERRQCGCRLPAPPFAPPITGKTSSESSILLSSRNAPGTLTGGPGRRDDSSVLVGVSKVEPEELVGQTVGNYRLVSVLGKGGMGTVYLGENAVIGSRVAIKVLHPRYCRDEVIVGRFFAEARAVNLIGHENIVRIFDLNTTEDGSYYFVMEYLEGVTLGDLIGPGHVPLDRVAPILYQVLDALGAAHQNGVIHRDLKLANIFVINAPERLMVKVLDFGIAKLHATETPVHTATGAVLGTPQFMSPEQAAGIGVDHRTDIYSFGVLLFRVLTGRLPFDSTSLATILLSHLQAAPPSPRALNPEISPALEALILKTLEKRADDRFQTVVEVREAIQTVVAGSTLASIQSPVRMNPIINDMLVPGPPPTPSTGMRAMTIARSPSGSSASGAASARSPSASGTAIGRTPSGTAISGANAPAIPVSTPPATHFGSGGTLEMVAIRPIHGARRHDRIPAELEVEVKIADPRGLERMYTTDISHFGMFIGTTAELPPLFTVIEIMVGQGRNRVRLSGRVVRLVRPNDESSQGLKPGMGIELIDLDDDKRAQIEAIIKGNPAPRTIASAEGTGPNAAAAAILERYRDGTNRSHYEVLRVALAADMDLVRDAVRKARRETDPDRLGPMPQKQADELAAVRKRIDQAVSVLINPRSRAEYDATLKNYLGVAQSLSAGLRVDDLKELRTKFLTKAKDAETAARAAVKDCLLAMYQKKTAEARVALERALEADPLNIELHHRYWAMRRSSSNTSEST
jgi:serine/threonine-protein kinase